VKLELEDSSLHLQEFANGPYPEPVESIPPPPVSPGSNLIPFSHLHLGLPSGLCLSDFPIKTLYTFVSSPMRATHSILLLLHPILVQIFSLEPCFQQSQSLNVRDQVSHPYKTTGRYIVLYNFNLYIDGHQEERQKTLSWLVSSIPRS
jgi:hypothetical protein